METVNIENAKKITERLGELEKTLGAEAITLVTNKGEYIAGKTLKSIYDKTRGEPEGTGYTWDIADNYKYEQTLNSFFNIETDNIIAGWPIIGSKTYVQKIGQNVLFAARFPRKVKIDPKVMKVVAKEITALLQD